MNTFRMMLAVAVLGMVAACASTSRTPAQRHRVSVTDDRQFNIQSRNFETSDQATGLEVSRRFEH